jgi:serine/threonine-protein kinase
MIGKVLNSRYEILEKIDTGGMAVVYLGKDNLLDREVAIKVLQSQFASNKQAVKRFHQEAKSVASLSHPNIVNIFDIGQEDDDLHYIIMEYIKGEDLKKKLQQEGILPPKRAVEIIKGVCRALIKAHRNNIVHCDIKPHNILLTEDGTVKVTDFGIARAVTGTTMTRTDSIRGSAHYLSPEQAKGEPVSTKSDIYSLGIVLYELLTGKLPFDGENSVSVALKHIEEEPPAPREINSGLPQEVEAIILRAIAKEPEARYNSVAEFLKEVKEAADKLTDNQVTNQPTMVLSREELKNSEEGTSGQEESAEETPLQDEEDQEIEFKSDSGKQVSRRQKNGKSRWKKILLTIGIIGLILFIVLGASYYFLVDYLTVPNVETPDIVEQEFEAAEEKLAEVGLEIEVYHRRSDNEIPEDHVISQSPQAGEVVKKNRTVEVVLSEGAQLTEAPKLEGKTLREAQVEVDRKNLVLGEVTEEYTSEVEEGRIISQEPAAEEEVETGTPINLVISQGPQPQEITVPDLVGLRREEAVEELRQQNLILGRELSEKSLNYREGQVIAQDPEPGTELQEGSTVQLIISSGIRNPYNSSIRERTINVNVPAGGQQKEVRIVIRDDNGERIVYQATHPPGENISQEVITVGPTIIRVYIDGQLYNEMHLEGE